MDREMVVSKLNKVVDETEEVNFGFATVEPDYLLSGFIPSIEHFVDMSRKAIDSNRLTHVECATKSGSAIWNLSFTFSGGIMSPTEGTYRPITQDKLKAGWEVSKITITPKLSQISFGLHQLNILYQIKLMTEHSGELRPFKIFSPGASEVSKDHKISMKTNEVIFAAKVDTDGGNCPTNVQFMIADTKALHKVMMNHL